MGYIYIIQNTINDKAYVGKTLDNVEKRFREHKAARLKLRSKDFPLYRAMNKYGIEKFYIKVLEEVDYNELNNREIYWINYFNSFVNGYNATRGGDGSHYIDYEKIIELYAKYGHIKKVADELNCCVDTVVKALNNSNIPIKQTKEVNREYLGKKIEMLSLSGETLLIFNSQGEAAEYLFNKKLTNSIDATSINIGRVCKGVRKTTCGYKWKYL